MSNRTINITVVEISDSRDVNEKNQRESYPFEIIANSSINQINSAPYDEE
jgi:hypothetical protein